MKYFAILVLVSLVGCASVPRPQDSLRITNLGDLVSNLEGQVAVKQDVIVGLNKKFLVLQDNIVQLRAQLHEQVAVLPPALAALGSDTAALESIIGDLQNQVTVYRSLADKDSLELEARMAEITELFASEIARGVVVVKKFRNVLVIEVKDAVLFAGDSPDLLLDNSKVLLNLARVFKKSPGRIVRVEGNTAVASSGPASLKLYPTSWHLAAARAANVAAFLQEKGGMDPRQLVVSSLGEFNPANTNATDSGKAANRRVEFVMVPRELWSVERLATMNVVTLP
jgi:flagellar motor protein MotB